MTLVKVLERLELARAIMRTYNMSILACWKDDGYYIGDYQDSYNQFTQEELEAMIRMGFTQRNGQWFLEVNETI